MWRFGRGQRTVVGTNLITSGRNQLSTDGSVLARSKTAVHTDFAGDRRIWKSWSVSNAAPERGGVRCRGQSDGQPRGCGLGEMLRTPSLGPSVDRYPALRAGAWRDRGQVGHDHCSGSVARPESGGRPSDSVSERSSCGSGGATWRWVGCGIANRGRWPQTSNEIDSSHLCLDGQASVDGH